MNAALSDPTLIDPRWDGKALIGALALLVITALVLSWLDAGRRIDAAPRVLLDTSVPLRERCAVLRCTERGVVTYGDFTVCRGHDPLGPVEEL